MRVRELTGKLGLLTLAFSFHGVSPAHAALEAPFDETLVEDQAYVADASNATDIAFHTDGRAVITQKTGQITIRSANGDLKELTGTFPNLDTGSEKGLLGVVADPSVATNDTFYFYASNGPTEDRHRVYKGVLNDDNTLSVDLDAPIVGASRDVGPGLEGPANHDGGGLYIYKGQLYVGVGDTGSNSEPPTNKYSSCLNKGNGKILRVNLDGSVPDDNPLVSEDMVTSCTSTRGDWGTAPPDRRIYAWGLRNPWRFWVDPLTDLLWIGDVGETEREEISIGGAGVHYGYPFIEGKLDQSMEDGDLRLDKMCDENFQPSRPCTAPVHDYPRDTGRSVTGGLIPLACGWSNAFGGKAYYLFADYALNWIHALEATSDRKSVVSPNSIDFASLSGGPASIRQGPDGAVYVVHYGSGTVTRIAPRDLTGPDCDPNMGTGGASGASGASGLGGAGASSGASGKGGSSGNGGMSVTSGAGGTAGSGASGAASGTAGANASGGAGGKGGATGGAGAPAGNGAGGTSGSSDDDSGCGCRTARDSSTGTLVATLVLGGIALGQARRRVRRRRERRA